ncbi:hypothetical protein CDCA_CDCA14G3762 [Cyanidium caldarium]|uniref:Cleavage/polyadenylation specificity factor A subunit N-terminal domain-containing protein n=1 Tax=Cyanidium caldarium TaxID=2771 RepID=A0AAV9IZH2_CYACA|nr:hypothetical protein CDCA_CDCA14G3762 [Cyanidium caldarium]
MEDCKEAAAPPWYVLKTLLPTGSMTQALRYRRQAVQQPDAFDLVTVHGSWLMVWAAGGETRLVARQNVLVRLRDACVVPCLAGSVPVTMAGMEAEEAAKLGDSDVLVVLDDALRLHVLVYMSPDLPSDTGRGDGGRFRRLFSRPSLPGMRGSAPNTPEPRLQPYRVRYSSDSDRLFVYAATHVVYAYERFRGRLAEAVMSSAGDVDMDRVLVPLTASARHKMADVVDDSWIADSDGEDDVTTVMTYPMQGVPVWIDTIPRRSDGGEDDAEHRLTAGVACSVMTPTLEGVERLSHSAHAHLHLFDERRVTTNTDTIGAGRSLSPITDTASPQMITRRAVESLGVPCSVLGAVRDPMSSRLWVVTESVILACSVSVRDDEREAAAPGMTVQAALSLERWTDPSPHQASDAVAVGIVAFTTCPPPATGLMLLLRDGRLLHWDGVDGQLLCSVDGTPFTVHRAAALGDVLAVFGRRDMWYVLVGGAAHDAEVYAVKVMRAVDGRVRHLQVDRLAYRMPNWAPLTDMQWATEHNHPPLPPAARCATLSCSDGGRIWDGLWLAGGLAPHGRVWRVSSAMPAHPLGISDTPLFAGTRHLAWLHRWQLLLVHNRRFGSRTDAAASVVLRLDAAGAVDRTEQLPALCGAVWSFGDRVLVGSQWVRLIDEDDRREEDRESVPMLRVREEWQSPTAILAVDAVPEAGVVVVGTAPPTMSSSSQLVVLRVCEWQLQVARVQTLDAEVSAVRVTATTSMMEEPSAGASLLVSVALRNGSVQIWRWKERSLALEWQRTVHPYRCASGDGARHRVRNQVSAAACTAIESLAWLYRGRGFVVGLRNGRLVQYDTESGGVYACWCLGRQPVKLFSGSGGTADAEAVLAVTDTPWLLRAASPPSRAWPARTAMRVRRVEWRDEARPTALVAAPGAASALGIPCESPAAWIAAGRDGHLHLMALPFSESRLWDGCLMPHWGTVATDNRPAPQRLFPPRLWTDARSPLTALQVEQRVLQSIQSPSRAGGSRRVHISAVIAAAAADGDDGDAHRDADDHDDGEHRERLRARCWLGGAFWGEHLQQTLVSGFLGSVYRDVSGVLRYQMHIPAPPRPVVSVVRAPRCERCRRLGSRGQIWALMENGVLLSYADRGGGNHSGDDAYPLHCQVVQVPCGDGMDARYRAAHLDLWRADGNVGSPDTAAPPESHCDESLLALSDGDDMVRVYRLQAVHTAKSRQRSRRDCYELVPLWESWHGLRECCCMQFVSARCLILGSRDGRIRMLRRSVAVATGEAEVTEAWHRMPCEILLGECWGRMWRLPRAATGSAPASLLVGSLAGSLHLLMPVPLRAAVAADGGRDGAKTDLAADIDAASCERLLEWQRQLLRSTLFCGWRVVEPPEPSLIPCDTVGDTPGAPRLLDWDVLQHWYLLHPGPFSEDAAELAAVNAILHWETHW